jgi:hypothetical protein
MRVAFGRFVFAGVVLQLSYPALGERLDELWLEERHMLESAGITKPMFRSLTLWSEGQYYLGFCNDHLPAGDVGHWRNWWERTIVPRSEAGKTILSGGTQTFDRGKADGVAQAPTQQVCSALLDSWMSDVTPANRADGEQEAGDRSAGE